MRKKNVTVPGWVFMVLSGLVLVLGHSCIAGPTTEQGPAFDYSLHSSTGSGWFFDDFSYTDHSDVRLAERHWLIRNSAGGPGVPGAQWSPDNIQFVDHPVEAGNRCMVVRAHTDGTAAGTSHAEIQQARKFYQGTYASRVRFNDVPKNGIDGDPVVQTFFTITPLNFNLDEEYGEIDFEYLPNTGWGISGPTLFATTWETYQPEPLMMINAQKDMPVSLDGWHTLVFTVGSAKVKYYLDGKLIAVHGNEFFPETPMSINYNIWFIDELMDRISGSTVPSMYEQVVDWVFYAGNQELSTDDVLARVGDLRARKVNHMDSVPPWTAPVLDSLNVHADNAPRPARHNLPAVTSCEADGNLHEWQAIAPFQILQEEGQVVYHNGTAVWGGARDLSARLWAGWSTDGLHLAAEITDNTLVQEWHGADIWQGDYIELQLDSDLLRDYSSSDMNEDDYQIGLSPGNFADIPPEVQVWKGMVPPEWRDRIRLAVKKTAEGYAMECFFPAQSLGLILAEGREIGIAISPSDCDDPQQMQKVMMSSSPQRRHNDPTSLGQAKLVQCKRSMNPSC